jgi:tetratricopeptide (TPR) repeat protein
MKPLCLLLVLAAMTAASFAQSSDDPDIQRLDSLGAQLDSSNQLDSPAMMHLVDSLSAEQPEDFGKMMQIGQGDLNAGRIQEALTEFDKAVQLVPDDPRALSLKGKTLTMLGRNAEALPSLDKAIELNPNLAEAHLDRAAARNLMNNPEAALSDLQAALEADTTLKHLARTSTFFQSLHDNPVFQKLVK